MGSSILSEGCKNLDSQDGALQRYNYSLNRLPVSRLLLPRSGLSRSDLVLGSKREKLKLSKSSPLHLTERTSMGRVVTSLMGQQQKSPGIRRFMKPARRVAPWPPSGRACRSPR